ncbi:MAG TPA: carbohydrate ABC transporter permease [Geminicoccaceae bacterium]|nr:carbohydrate ABC transporter permease [Geminicoccus sp.]HMU48138.1 carbohydrate ABC transporter permease [Geminicoccaceae bacterium]
MRQPPFSPAWILRRLGLLAVVFWSGFPILFIVLSSLKQSRDIFIFPPVWIFEPTFEHYVELWQKWPDFFTYMRNSLIIACFATLLAVTGATLAGYVYSRYRSRLLTASAFFLIAVRLFPPIVITLPLFPTADWLGLSDTHLLLVLLYATFFVSLNTVIMKTFIDGLSTELDDAARVDGATEWQTLWRVILPLTAQGMVAAAVFVFVFSWNEFLFAFIFTTSNAKTTPLIISELMGALTGVDWGMLFAAVSLQLVPIGIFVIVLQRFLIAGLTAGSLKG